MEKTNEIKEAIQAATIVLEKLQEAHKHLKKAKNYGWLDVFRLDIFDIPKRLYMRQAEKFINEAKTYIMHFEEELKDVDNLLQVDLSFFSLAAFSDFFWDGLYGNSQILAQICDAYDNVGKAISQVEEIIQKLKTL